MTRPRAVVFDLGRVLLDFDYAIALRRLLPRVRVGWDELHRWFGQSPLLLDYETGRLTTPEFFAQVRSATGFAGDLIEFSGLFVDIFTEIPAMVAMHGEVRERGFPTYILSNTNELTIQYIRRRFRFFSLFEGYVLSYEQRAMKPAPRLYEVTEGVAGLRGADLFYFDDLPENVEAARRRGWQAVVHQSPERSRAALVAAGVLGADPSGG